MAEFIPPPIHAHGPALRQEQRREWAKLGDDEACRRGFDLLREEKMRYPNGSIVRCCCGELIRCVVWEQEWHWKRMGRWRRWRMRRELAMVGLRGGGGLSDSETPA